MLDVCGIGMVSVWCICALSKVCMVCTMYLVYLRCVCEGCVCGVECV